MHRSEIDQRVTVIDHFDRDQDYVERLIAERNLFRDVVIEAADAYTASYEDCASTRLRDAALSASNVRQALAL